MVKSLTNPFEGRPVPLGTLLSTAGRRLAAELDAGLRAAGFADLRSAHAPLFMAIDAEGSSVTALAERAGMTKQAMGELVRYLERHGYAEVSVPPEDRRGRRVCLTERGWEAVAAGVQVIDDFDSWLEAAVGAETVDRLRDTVDRIIHTDPATWRTAPDGR